MKNIILTVSLLVIVLSSCRSQNTDFIKGNWYLDNDFESENFDYTEVYVDNDYFHYYNDIAGLSIPRKYKINDSNSIFLVDFNISYKFEIIDDDTFMMLNEKEEKIVYKRVLGTNNLSKYISKEINENLYYNAIENRKKKISLEKATRSNGSE